MEGVACNQDYDEFEVLLSEMPKTPCDSSIQEATSAPFGKANFETYAKHLPAFNLPDEDSLATAFADMSFNDHIGIGIGTGTGTGSSTSSSSWAAALHDPSCEPTYAAFNYNSSISRNGFPSYSPITKSNSSLYERSKLHNIPAVYMCNVPVNASNTRVVTDVPVSASPILNHHLYNSQYQLMNPSGTTLDELEPKIHSRNLPGLQNLRQPGLSVCDRYWRNTQLSADCQSIYPDGYNSELLIGLGDPRQIQYAERLRRPLFSESFSGMTTPRSHGHMSPQRIIDMAKDQNGCLYLQNLLKEGTPSGVAQVFVEIIANIVDLMIDPFGNYLVQMLLERCNETQKALVVYEITKVPGQLLLISCDMHGTRAVQKVIETIKRSPGLISRVISSLNPGALDLMMDANGSHVMQRCLQHMDPEYTMFILEIALRHCFDLAKNRQGCCVLQKCIHHSTEKIKIQLVHSVTANTLILAEDPYGNYVIQYIIEMKVPWMTNRIVNQLDSRFGALSMQKFSSNVVEKCLKLGGDANRARIIHELMIKPEELLDISLDQFGNYVVQSALASSKGALRATLMEAIRPHAPALRNSSYGRRVLGRMGMKNK